LPPAGLTGGAVLRIEIIIFSWCYYLWKKEKVFKGHTWEGDLEIVSIGGNINTMNGETYTHFHISVADESGNVYGGHLTEAVISGTGELVLTEIEGTVDRKFDEEIGLNLFEF